MAKCITEGSRILFPTHYRPALVAIGPGQICVSKKGRQFSDKDFPRGQVSGLADNLDFEKKLKCGSN